MKQYPLILAVAFLSLALVALIVPKANADPPIRIENAKFSSVKHFAGILQKIDAETAVFVSYETVAVSAVKNAQGLIVLKPSQKVSGHYQAPAFTRPARTVSM